MSEPYPSEPDWWLSYFRPQVVERYDAAGVPLDDRYLIWGTRTAYDIAAGMTKEASAERHLAELDVALGLAHPPAEPTHPDPIRGRLRIANGLYVDDSGPVLPTLCHFGEAFSAYIRRPDDARRQLEAIARAGYQGIRFWDVLGYHDQAWAGKEVTPTSFRNKSGQMVPATPAYYDQLTDFLRLCQSLQLGVHHSRGDLNSLPFNDVRTHCQVVGAVQRNVGASVVLLNESCNESWQNGVSEPSRLAEMASALGGHAIQALSCLEGATEVKEDLDAYSIDPADVFYVHGFRQNRSLDRIRHIFTIAYEAKPNRRLGWQGEPAGPGDGVTVGQENHPEALALMCAMSLLSRQAWVYMSSPGVFWDGPIEAQPGFHAVAQVKTWLPKDLMRPATLCHGGASWAGTRVLVANAEGTLRCDHAMFPDGQVAIIVYGEPGTWTIPVERAVDGRVIDPLTGVAHPVSLRPGQLWPVTFARGRVLLGRLA